MKPNSKLAGSFLALLSVLLAVPSGAQIQWGNFQILGCQGGYATNLVDGSGNLVIHTSQPTFNIFVSTFNTTATGLIGETCGPINAAYPSPSATNLPGVQGLWKFDNDMTDSAGGNNLTNSSLDGNTAVVGSVAPVFVTAKNGAAGLGQALQEGASLTGQHNFGTTPSAINFSGFAAFSVEAWVNVSGGGNCTPASVANCPASPFNTCSGSPGNAGTCNFGFCSLGGAACSGDGTACNGFGTCQYGICSFGGGRCSGSGSSCAGGFGTCNFNTCVSGGCSSGICRGGLVIGGTCGPVGGGCGAFGTCYNADFPILSSCPSPGTTDKCLSIAIRDCSTGGGGQCKDSSGNVCGTPAVGAGGLTPYFDLGNDAVCGGNLSAGWHHLAFISQSGANRVYIDGVLVSGGVVTPSGSGATGKFTGAATAASIGGGNTVSTVGVGIGDLDSVRIYNGALTHDVIASNALGQWFSIANDGKLDGNLSGQYCPGAGQPGTPTNSWQWGFGANRNIIPTAGGQDTNGIAFTFAEEDTNEFIAESNNKVDVRQVTMTTPPNPSMVSPFDQSTLAYQIPVWFCAGTTGPNFINNNTTYTWNVGNCGFTNCSATTPVFFSTGQALTQTLPNLNTNTRYDVNVTAKYFDASPGDGVLIGPSAPTPSTAAATLAWPPGIPNTLTTTGNTSVNVTLNITTASIAAPNPCPNADGPLPAGTPCPNPTWTAIAVQGSLNNGGSWGQISSFNTFSNVGSSPRSINFLQQSSKYIFRAQNENLDGILTSPGADSRNNGGGDQFLVTQPLTPTNFSGTSQQGTPGLTCPKTQIMYTWNAVPIGSNQPPSASATVPNYLVTDGLNNPLPGSGAMDNACTGCLTSPSYLYQGLTPNTLYITRLYSFDPGAPLAPMIRYSNFSQTVSQTAPAVISAPSSVAGAPLVGGIQWSWNAPPNLCSPWQYTVFNAVTLGLAVPNGAGVNPFNNSASVVTYTQTGLGPNQESSIQVQAFDSVGGGETSPLSLPTTSYSQAFPPINLTFTGVSTGAVVLQWSGNGNPSYTRYEVSESPDNFTNVISTPVNISQNNTADFAPIRGLQPGTTYYFRVRAINGQASDGSGTVFTTFVTGAAMTLFYPPSVVGAALPCTPLCAIQWSWPTIGVSSPSAYQVVLVNPPAGIQQTNQPPFAYPANLTYTPGGLAVNTQYGVQVLALNGQGLPSPSPVVNVYTLANPPTHLASDIAGVSSNTITYQWNPNGNPAGTFYELDVATNPAYVAVVTTQTPRATAATVPGLFPLTTYFAEVRAYNGDLIPNPAYLVLASTRTDGDPNVTQSSAPPNAYQVASGAVGQWHFDEDTGTVSRDVSGFINSASLTCVSNGCASTPTWTSGPAGLGSAVSYSGQLKSFTQINDAAQYHFTTSLTLEAWVNPATLAEINGAGLIAKGPFNGEDFYLDVFNSKYRFSACQGSVGQAALSSQDIVPGQWTHVVGIYDSAAQKNSIYVNGALSGTGVGTCARGASTAVNVTVGNRLSGTPAYDLGFSGAIDEVRIISGLYSAAQVKQDYLGSLVSTVTMLGANKGLQVGFAPNAFGGPATIYASNDPVNHPLKVSVPELMLGLANAPTRQILIPGMFYEIVPIVNGAQFTGPLATTATVAMSYSADASGLITNLQPSVAVSTLKIYTLDTSVGQWVYLPTTIDTINHNIVFQTPHFSVFAAFGTATTGITTTEARVFPVPWKRGSGGTYDAPNLTFANLPASGSVRIYSMAGLRVADIQFSPANAGTATWNGLNFDGRPAASGVYFALIKTTDGSTRVLKIAIER